MGDSGVGCCHPHGSEAESGQIQRDHLGKNVDLSAANPQGLRAVSQLSAVSSWTSEDSQPESELTYRNFFSGTLKIVKALAQGFLTEMLLDTDQETEAER